MTIINPDSNGALMCARMRFAGDKLTVSVNGRAKSGLLETIIMFSEYFSEQYQDKELGTLELFLTESDMHEGKGAWQTTHFDKIS